MNRLMDEIEAIEARARGETGIVLHSARDRSS
jgi:hypothetical protein